MKPLSLTTDGAARRSRNKIGARNLFRFGVLPSLRVGIASAFPNARALKRNEFRAPVAGHRFAHRIKDRPRTSSARVVLFHPCHPRDPWFQTLLVGSAHRTLLRGPKPAVPVPQGRPIVAQHFNAGVGRNQTSPLRDERNGPLILPSLRDSGPVVGTPSDESLGYSRSSLRDCADAGRKEDRAIQVGWSVCSKVRGALLG